MVKEKGRRKVRSDKKREVQPTIPIELKDTIYRLSYITNSPVKDVAERICVDGIISRKVLDGLSQHFRRSIRFENTQYLGYPSRPSLQRKSPAGLNERIGIRFKQHTYENISSLAFALDCTPSRATALLLEASIHNSEFINEYFQERLQDQLDERRMAELKKVLEYINANNPYDEKISWGLLLSYLYEEMKEGASTVSESITTFVSKWK